jgi:hypothetical protein
MRLYENVTGPGRRPGRCRFASRPARAKQAALKHDPEKWLTVFGKDHAQTKR